MIKNPTPNQLLEIATWEKRLMWSIVAMIAVNLLAQFVDPIIGLLALVIVVFQLFAIYRFGSAAKVGAWKWLVMICTFIPLVGLAAIVILVVRVNRIFKDLGIPVGLMGPKVESIQNIESEQSG
jgi:hypothetical protein